MNPVRSREWITSDGLASLLDRWGDRIGLALFSDLVSHAVVRGTFAMDKTYLVPPEAFRDRRRSTAAVLERFWAGGRVATDAQEHA